VFGLINDLTVRHEAELQREREEALIRANAELDALNIAASEVDFFVEVGPGTVLTGIAAECTDKPVLPLDAGGESLHGLLSAVGAAFAFGANVRTSPLFEKRFGRPIDIRKKHSFLSNPCEMVPPSAPNTRPAKTPA
jgi:enediyne polyketide synthase